MDLKIVAFRADDSLYPDNHFNDLVLLVKKGDLFELPYFPYEGKLDLSLKNQAIHHFSKFINPFDFNKLNQVSTFEKISNGSRSLELVYKYDGGVTEYSLPNDRSYRFASISCIFNNFIDVSSYDKELIDIASVDKKKRRGGFVG